MKVYRTDIDGLRAIAVLLVALFHAQTPFFAGGFVGVDVFFVISGFLITGIISREIESGTFSFARFYERRCRRILPILFVVIVTTAALGWLINSPREFELLGRSIILSALFANNIGIYRTPISYFDPDSEVNPFLHLWSLSVEEQFYLIFPCLLVALYRWKPSRVVPVLMIVSALSLVGSELASLWNPKAAFYFLHYRAWELLVGALIAVRTRRFAFRKTGAEWLASIGLILILGPALFYSEHTRFPGVSALPPTLGTALILATGIHQNTLIHRLLSIRPMAIIGRVSFSFYLWHWPLLVFGQFVSTTILSLGHRLGIVGVSLVFSYFSWRFIEKPLRSPSWPWPLKTQAVLAGASASLIFLGVLGHQIFSPNGFIRVAHGRTFTMLISPMKGSYNRSVGNETVVWGDSHSAQFCDANPSVDCLALSSCIPLSEISYSVSRDRGLTFQPECSAEPLKTLAANKRVKRIVVSGRWDFYYFGHDTSGLERLQMALCLNGNCAKNPAENQKYFRLGLEKTFASLKALKKEVVVLGPLPSLSFDPNRLTRVSRLLNVRPPQWTPTAAQSDSVEQVETLLTTLCAKNGFKYISLFKLLCRDGCQYHTNEVSLFRDSHHLTTPGAQMIWERAFEARQLSSPPR